jgi:hypothetical protein
MKRQFEQRADSLSLSPELLHSVVEPGARRPCSVDFFFTFTTAHAAREAAPK